MISNIKYNIAILMLALFAAHLSLAGTAAIFHTHEGGVRVCILINDKISKGQVRSIIVKTGVPVVPGRIDRVSGSPASVRLDGIGHPNGECTLNVKEKKLFCNSITTLKPSTDVEIIPFPGNEFDHNVPAQCQ